MTTKDKGIVKTTPKATRDLTPFEEMDRLFDTMFNRRWLRPFDEMFPQWPFVGERRFDLKMPRVDVLDRDDEIMVRAELPGIDKKELNINLSGQTLTIKGESRHKNDESEDEYYRSEITQGEFSRTIRLPEEVDGKHTKAEFKDGMLEIRLPKTHKVERRTIEVA